MADTRAKTKPSPLTSAVLPGLQGSLALGQTAMQAWMDMGMESLRFVSERLQEDIKTQQALLQCKSLDELRAVQAAFFKAAQEHYMAEATKMMNMAVNFTKVEPTATSRDGRLGYDDVPV